MIKGAQKQMIVVRTGNSPYFDEAYFVLRKEVKTLGENRDILQEANRILEESRFSTRQGSKRGRRGWLSFAVGLFSGGAVAALLFLLL